MCLIFFFFFPLNLTRFLYCVDNSAYDFLFALTSLVRVKKRHKSADKKKRDQNKKLLSLSLSLSPRLLYDNGDEEYAFLRRDVV